MQRQAARVRNRKQPSVIVTNPSGGAIWQLVTRVFGCRHKEMSRPFTSQGQTYRTCLDCGGRRRFNVNNWQMQGDFYFRLPTSTCPRPLNGLPAL